MQKTEEKDLNVGNNNLAELKMIVFSVSERKNEKREESAGNSEEKHLEIEKVMGFSFILTISLFKELPQFSGGQQITL